MITGKNFKYFVFLIILLFSLVKISHAEEKSGYDIKFANTFFIEHFSDMLYNDVRTEHKTIADEPSFYFNEKFQIVYPFGNKSENKSSTGCCIDIPSAGYISYNIVYIHHENYAVSTGMQIELGAGDYKDPFISIGIGGVYQKDMVFNSSENGNLNWLFNIGYKHDIHIKLDLENKVFNGPAKDQSDRTAGKIDIALGKRELTNFFILFHYDEFDNETYNHGTGYAYYHITSLVHLQYFGDLYGLSLGYTYNAESYYLMTYYNTQTDRVISDTTKLDYRKSHGGGLTFYANNSDSSAELFGEFHLLADKDMNWMTISKLGVKVYF